MGTGHDRISELPDPILGHILSFMPAKAATQTSILSRRWRGLWELIWSSATTLDFAGEFAARQTPEEFVCTVNRYLNLHRGKKIRRLLVSLEPDGRFISDVEKWVEFAGARDVEDLRLDFSSELQEPYYVGVVETWVSDFKAPHHLFDCTSLRILSLSNCGFPRAPDFGRLRWLKSLALCRVAITDDELRRILSDCYFLEHLLLRDCVHFNSIKLTSPAIGLRQLVLVDCWELFDLEISTRSLESFHFFGEINFDHSFGGISRLGDAFICSIGRSFGEPHQNYIKLLSDLAHVEILTVCTATLMCVTVWSEYMPEDLPVLLPKLRELQLLMDFMNPEYLSFIYGFFRLCPSPFLERLFVRLPETLANIGERGTAFEQPPDLYFTSLKMIKMHNFKGSRSEMDLVGLLLETAPALESLILVTPPKPCPGDGVGVGQDGSSPRLKFMEEMDMRILQGQLLALPRMSPAAQIVVCEYLQDDTNISPIHTELYGYHN